MSTKFYSRILPVLGLGLCASLLPACFSETTKSEDNSATKDDKKPAPPTTTKGDAGEAAPPTSGPGGGEPAADVEIIDDMESGTSSIRKEGGRDGAWYVYNDKTTGATQTPGVPFEHSAGGYDGSAFAAATKGSGFKEWGAGMGFNFNDPGDGAGGSKKAPYDASAYKGIAFWAKAGAGSTTTVRVNVSDKDTDAVGKTCSKCDDHFGKNISLTPEWKYYTIAFADLKQSGWGDAVAKFDPKSIIALQFQVGKGTTFDIWVDDVAFLK